MHDILFNLFGKKINKTVHPSQFALGNCNVVNMLLILFHSRFVYRIEIIGLLDWICFVKDALGACVRSVVDVLHQECLVFDEPMS